jgi:hypothetical protein
MASGGGGPGASAPPASGDGRTLGEARASYFARNGFGADGGYAARWVDFKLGPIPFPFPNSAARVRAVRFHDLHHVVTGYATDFVGELEISAWELGGGCAGLAAAWALNLGGFAAGLLVAPRRVFAALARGRRSRNLYRERFDDRLLARRVGEVRRALGLAAGPPRASAADVAAAFGFGLAGALVALAAVALLAPVAPAGALALRAARRRAAAG